MFADVLSSPLEEAISLHTLGVTTHWFGRYHSSLTDRVYTRPKRKGLFFNLTLGKRQLYNRKLFATRFVSAGYKVEASESSPYFHFSHHGYSKHLHTEERKNLHQT